MLKNILKIIKAIVFTTLVILITSIIGVYIWLSSGERSIGLINNILMNRFENYFDITNKIDLKKVRVSMNLSDVYLIIDEIEPKNLSNQINSITSVKLKINTFSLIANHKQPKIDIEIDRLSFDIKDLSDDNANTAFPFVIMNDFLSTFKDNIKYATINFVNSSITLANHGHNPFVMHVDHISLKPIIQKENVLISMAIRGDIEDERVDLKATLDTTSRQKLIIDGTLTNLSYSIIEKLGFGIPLFTKSNLKLDFDFKAIISSFNLIDSFSFSIKGNNGLISQNSDFKEDINISEVIIAGIAKDNFTYFKSDNIKITANGIELYGECSFKNHEFNLDIKLDNINKDTLLKFWPVSLSVKARKWIEDHLLNIEANNVVANFCFTVDELITKHKFDEDNITIKIPFKNGVIQYPLNAPKLNNLSGVINIFSDYITINVDDINVLNSVVKNIDLKIYDLHKKDTYLNLKALIEGPLQESIDIAFIEMKEVNDEFTQMNGNSNSYFNLTLPLIERDLVVEDVDITVNSKIQNFNYKILNKYTITNGVFNFNVKDRQIKLDGLAKLNEIPINITYNQPLTSNPTNELKVNLNINKDNAKNIDINFPQFFGGQDINVTYIKRKVAANKDEQIIDFNLINNSIDLPKFGIRKLSFQPGNLIVRFSQTPSAYIINGYNFNIPNIKSIGSGEINSDFRVKNINSPQTIVNNSSFNFNYQSSNSDSKLTIKGSEVDLSNIDFLKSLDKSDFEFNKPLLVEADLNSIILKNNNKISYPKFKLKCSKNKCDDLSLDGKLNSQNISIIYSKQAVYAISQNAEALMKSIDLSNSVREGMIEIKGHYIDDDHLSGSLIMNKFYLSNMPILSKVLSISALTTASGILNILHGSGLYFDTFSCPFDYQNKILTIHNCVSHGPTLTLQFEGNINFDNKKLDISGTFIPANIINSVVSSIPYIGELLSGGKDSGVIGTNFTIKGSVDDPSIMVNPLSILTPGFLRKIFSK